MPLRHCHTGVADAEILFDDIAHFGYLFVSFDFKICKLCGGRILSHDAVLDIVHCQKFAIGFSGAAFVGIDRFNGCLCMLAVNGAIIAQVSVVDRGQYHGGGQDEAVFGIDRCMFFEAEMRDIVFDGPV